MPYSSSSLAAFFSSGRRATSLRSRWLHLAGHPWFSRAVNGLVMLCIVALCVVPPFEIGLHFVPWRSVGDVPRLLGDGLAEHATAIYRSLIYTGITTLGQCLLGTVAALSVYEVRRRWLRKLLATLFIVPYAVPSFAGVLGWKFLLGERGPLAQFLAAHKWVTDVNLLGHDDVAFVLLCAVSIWQFFPFVFFFVYYILQGTPEQSLRCAAVEGLNSSQRLGVLLLPRILPLLSGLFIVRGLFMFSKYDTAALLGGAGVVPGLRILPVALYEEIGNQDYIPLKLRVFLAAMCLGTAAVAMLYAVCVALVPGPRVPASWLGRVWLDKAYVALRWVCLLATPVFVLLPIILLCWGSLLPSGRLDRGIALSDLSHGLILNNYVSIGKLMRDLRPALVNSLLCIVAVGGVSVVVATVCGHLASRVVDRRSYLGNMLITFAYALPPIVLIAPYGALSWLFPAESAAIVILANVGFVLPFCIRLASEYFSSVPATVDMMAANDGAWPMQSLLGILVPILKAELGMIALFAVIIAWSDILFSRYLGVFPPRRTALDMLDQYLKNSSDQTDYGAAAAFGVLVALAAVFVFAVLQKYVFEHRKALRGDG